ncbi:MAG: hypothetical protein ACUZ77_10100 [Candidatus Brocadiales bacterium]
MKANRVIEEASDVASKYNLQLVEIDRTDKIISLKLLIDSELFIQIYGNAEKDKLNLALVFKKRRLYGYDSEGGKYHCHPFDDSDGHIFIDEKKSIQVFVQESMRFLEEKGIL